MKSKILKIALFATGLSGIVAEYILSTLATYFLGDSVLQWTLIVSVMMFAMGLGSQVSKFVRKNLLQTFILVEFTLSILVAFSSLVAYTAATYLDFPALIIYTFAIMIGFLIGMEIPLVIRVNDEFQSLRVNVASVMQLDYLGSLAGGLFYAFVALPHIGLTYTPFILATVNLSVALLLYSLVRSKIERKPARLLDIGGVSVAALLTVGFFVAQPIVLFGEQARYRDKIVFAEQSKYQRIVITQWRKDYWLFINGNQQLSTLDEELYHEPLVHPIMTLHPYPQRVMVLGGGDGCAVREILKHPSVERVDLVDLDPAMTNLGLQNPIMRQLNESSLHSPKVHIHNQDGYTFMEQDRDAYFDVIIIDLPDPKTVELGRLYSQEFYQLCKRKLRPHGLIITQAGSPYYATDAFKCIDLTMRAAGYSTQGLHNQVLTLGEWGWVLGSTDIPQENLSQRLRTLKFGKLPTRWLNDEAMLMMTSFGKGIYPGFKVDSVQINTVQNPVLYRYYLNGNWDIY